VVYPPWLDMTSLEFLPNHVRHELSIFLPWFTITLNDHVYVAHHQVCCLLGLTTGQLFEKCSPSEVSP
jgi:hypothetical protein